MKPISSLHPLWNEVFYIFEKNSKAIHLQGTGEPTEAEKENKKQSSCEKGRSSSWVLIFRNSATTWEWVGSVGKPDFQDPEQHLPETESEPE